MASKKIKLKVSASAINIKAAAKKKKLLPKLKVILANPYKAENAKLLDDELTEFKNVISSEIASSGLTGRQFVREKSIQLGLGSSLRAINNTKSACALISQSIKPKFIISQIGYFSKQRNSCAPVYVVDKLETLTEDLFGVKASVVVFPLTLTGKLENWITKRTLPTKDVHKCITDKTPTQLQSPPKIEDKIDLNSIYLLKKSNHERAFVPEVFVKSTEPVLVTPSKDWTGDYISFSNEKTEDMEIDDDELRRKHNRILEGFGKLAQSGKSKDSNSGASKNQKLKPNEVLLKASHNVNHSNTKEEQWESEAELSYLGLEVLKIQPNPNRKQKTKKKPKKCKNKL